MKITCWVARPVTVPWWFIAALIIGASLHHMLVAALIIIVGQFLPTYDRTNERTTQ